MVFKKGDGKELYRSKKYDFSIHDRVGAGVLKHSIDGDANIVTEKEVLELAGGNVLGSVQR